MADAHVRRGDTVAVIAGKERGKRGKVLRVLLTEYSKYVLALARGIVPLRPNAEGVTLAEASALKN